MPRLHYPSSASLQIVAMFLSCSCSSTFLSSGPTMRIRREVYRMAEEIPNNTSSPGEVPGERYLPVSHGTSPVNYHNFGGFGGIRHGFNDPSRLNRNHYPHPPVSRARPRPACDRDRSASPLMIDYFAEGSRHRESVQGTLNDCPMITPDPSRNPSVVARQDIFATYAGARVPYEFGVPATIQPPGDIHNQGPTTYRLSERQSIDSILNQPSSLASCGEAHLSTHTPGLNNPSTSHNNQQVPNSLTPPGSPSLTHYSTISTDTIRPGLSIQEQRYFHFITLYNSCLDASNTHISSLRRNHRITSRRYHPYSPPPPYHSPLRSPQFGTLMDNISAICTHMWRKARNDSMAPHRAEADAVRVMRDLYAWGEVVVRGLEESGGLGFGEDVEMESLGGCSEEESGAVRVGEAAKSFCRWLRDRRAWGTCEEVLEELQELEECEFGRERGEVSDDGPEIL